MTMIRRATSGTIENVAELEDKSTNGAVVCKACSHVVFRVNLGANGNCPYCHRDVNASIENNVVGGADDDDDDDVVAIKC